MCVFLIVIIEHEHCSSSLQIQRQFTRHWRIDWWFGWYDMGNCKFYTSFCLFFKLEFGVIFGLFQWQVLKPIYKGCMEKGIQQVSIQVAENALGPSPSTKKTSSQQNGKVRKRSWECATTCSLILNNCKYRAQAHNRNLTNKNISNVSL